MTYTPPVGWLEPTVADAAREQPRQGTFHLQQNCPKIERPEDLRAVDKPYSARRCRHCAVV